MNAFPEGFFRHVTCDRFASQLHAFLMLRYNLQKNISQKDLSFLKKH